MSLYPCCPLQIHGCCGRQSQIHSCLLLDGEAVYKLVANPLLLLLARVLLVRCSSKMAALQVKLVSRPSPPHPLFVQVFLTARVTF